MTPHDYWTERGKLGQALRDLRWERRAITDIFRHAQDPCILAAGIQWLGEIQRQDMALCRQIRTLDVRYQLEG